MKDFIKGVLFVSIAIPVMDGVITVINQGIEHICTKIAVKTYEAKKQIQEKEDEEPAQTNAIGFQISTYENNDYEEEE